MERPDQAVIELFPVLDEPASRLWILVVPTRVTLLRVCILLHRWTKIVVIELRERSGARAFPMPDVDDRAVGRKVESAFVGRSRFSRDRLLAEMRAAAASKLRRAGQHHTKLVLVVV